MQFLNEGPPPPGKPVDWVIVAMTIGGGALGAVVGILMVLFFYYKDG